MDLREIEWGDMDLINLAQDRDQPRALVNTLMKYRVPQFFYIFLYPILLFRTLTVSRISFFFGSVHNL
jgi:hypothetical protein